MFVVGENLKALIDQHGIVDDQRAFDKTSLTLRLGRAATIIEPDGDRAIVYGDEVPDSWIKAIDIPDRGHVLSRHSCLLGCSVERIRIPPGYLGLIQTKGSLAPLFVMVHCCDAQIDPGFEGQVTFEIVNLGPANVTLRAGDEVAQLFVAKTTTKEVVLYNGRYQGAIGPTTFKKALRAAGA